MNTLLIGIGIILFIIILLAVTKKSTKKPVPGNLIFDKYSEHGKVWVKKMWDMYQAGLTWDKIPTLTCDVYEKTFSISLALNQYGTKYNSYKKDIGVPENYFDAEETSLDYKLGNFFFELSLYLDMRFRYQYEPLTSKNALEVMKEFGLNIDSNEILYYSSIKIDWYEEETISTNVSYTGFRYRTGGQMSFNTGTFNVAKDNVKGFILLDRGSLYITNKRIIFISNGSIQNRSINLNDILEFIIYKDGILLGKVNGKKPLIFFPEALNTLLQPDGLNVVIRILDRLLSGNQNEDLTPQDYKTLNDL